MLESIQEVLMRRDGLSKAEAQDSIEAALEDLRDMLDAGGSLVDAEDIIYDHFGLEPDYLEELLGRI